MIIGEMKIKGLKENAQVKDKVGTLKTRLNSPIKITPEKLAKDSLKRVHSSEVGSFLVKLA